MFNRAITLALLVGGLGIAAAGCEALYKDRKLFAGSQPKKEAVEPSTEAVISRGNNKPQTRAQELDQHCADKTGEFITTYVEVRGKRFTCKEYVALRAQGWFAIATETDRPGKSYTVERIIRLKNAGVSDEVIIQLLRSGRGKLP